MWVSYEGGAYDLDYAYIYIYRKTISSTSASLKELKFYYFSRSLLAVNLRKFFIEKYSIDIDAFDMKTICARIDFVQRNEPRSNYIYVQP